MQFFLKKLKHKNKNRGKKIYKEEFDSELQKEKRGPLGNDYNIS
jgi:hypothetical protein